MAWTPEIYHSRIADPALRTRHAAGSPSPEEIESYLAACAGADFAGGALVLGMTPELRTLAAGQFRRVVSVDRSSFAIELFEDWLPEELKNKETIVEAEWTELVSVDGIPFSVVFGDGVIANLNDSSVVLAVLRGIHSILKVGGRCVMRNVVLGESLDLERYQFGRLLEDFRSGRIDAAEFGFCSRFLGFLDIAYDRKSGLLDGSVVYGRIDAIANSGLLSQPEILALNRYRFMGMNYFPTEEVWKDLVTQAGFSDLESQPGNNKLWNEYYPVQSFFRADLVAP